MVPDILGLVLHGKNKACCDRKPHVYRWNRPIDDIMVPDILGLVLHGKNKA